MGRAPGASLQGEDPDCAGDAPHIMEEWERLDQRVIENAVKQWCRSAYMLVSLQTTDILKICYGCHRTFAVNAEFIIE